MRDRARRVASLVGFGARRVAAGLTGGGGRRLVLAVVGVAVAVALVTTVSGVALGLASQSAVQADGVDYWIVPEGGDLGTIAAATDGPRLGSTHEVASRLRADPRVTYATPVLLQVVSVEAPATDTREPVLLVGVVVPESAPRVAGLPTRPLAPGDPHYANGTYNGPWTGEFVASRATADLLGVGRGDRVAAGGRAFRVTAVAEGGLSTGAGALPVALVHLAELQTATGANEGDVADQILVGTNAGGVRDDLAGVYPRTTVVTRTGLAVRGASTTSLPVAMAAAAFVVALAVGGLFTATTMGLEVVHDRRSLATLGALGYADRSLALLVAVETVSLCLLGGLAGVALGVGGIALTNAVAARTLGVGSVGLVTPLLVPYGLAVATLVGLLAVPYPVWLARRTTTSEVLAG